MLDHVIVTVQRFYALAALSHWSRFNLRFPHFVSFRDVSNPLHVAVQSKSASSGSSSHSSICAEAMVRFGR
jgi:hypothetical protein